MGENIPAVNARGGPGAKDLPVLKRVGRLFQGNNQGERMGAVVRTGGRAAAGTLEKRGDPGQDLALLVEQWPGPAAAIGRDGSVACANAAAGPLLDALRAASGGLAAVGAAQSGRMLEPLTIAGPRGPETYEIAIVPADGRVLVTARDISLAANMRVALADSRRRYKDLVEISSDFAWETDRAGAFVFVSPRGALGFTAEELVGRDASFILIDDEDEAGGARVSPFAPRCRLEWHEVWARGADGAQRRVAISALPLFDADGAYSGARGLCRDVTDALARDTALAEARNRERLLAYLTRTIRDEVEPEAMLAAAAGAIARALGANGSAIWRVGSEGAVVAAQFGEPAPAALDSHDAMADLRAARLSQDAAVEIHTDRAHALAIAASYRHAVNGAVVLWRGPGRPAWSESDRAVMTDFAGQLGIALAQLAQHEALARHARTDAMTGLLNRRTFAELLRQRLAQAKRTGRSGALLYLDLDNFKLVNDRFGHQKGDEALKAVAVKLKDGSRVGDLAARLGGDEFALWLEEVDLQGAVAKAKALLAMNAELAPFSGDPARPLGLSVGVALHRPGRPETDEELMARADAAMYRIKHATKNGLEIAPDAGEAA